MDRTCERMWALSESLVSDVFISEISQENNLWHFKDFIYLLLVRVREEKRARNIDVQEIHQSVASCTPPTGDPTRSLGTCPDWEWNLRPFSSQVSAQSTEPHHHRRLLHFKKLTA